MPIVIILFIIVNFSCSKVFSQTPSLIKVFTGFNFPVDIVCNGVDSGLYIAELSGRIRYVPDLKKDSSIMFGVIPNVEDTIANGLYGLTFHPEYPDSNYIYAHYTYDTTFFESRLSRFEIINNTLDSLSELILLSYDNELWLHQGGNLLFGNDGYLYLPTGYGDDNNLPKINGQNPMTIRGAILRLDVDKWRFYSKVTPQSILN